MTTTAPSGGLKYDPASTATSLATAYVSGQQDLLTTQTKNNKTAIGALASLKSALLSYQTSLASLGGTKSMLSNTASFSATGYGSASAGPTAAPGNYSFFVDSVAAASQQSYGIGAGLHDGGSLIVNVGVTPIVVSLTGADTDANGTLSAKELAAAINAAPANGDKARASVVTINGAAKLVITATQTGLSSAITLDASDPALDPALAAALNSPTELVAAKDAVIYFGGGVGGAGGVKIEQASNTFAVVDQVSMTFTKAQAPTDAPLTLTVGSDTSATTANVQSFVDAYNKLKTVLDGLTSVGDPQNGVAAGAFANDGALNVLRNRLLDSIRTAVPGVSATLASYGITSARNGLLTLDSSRLQSTLALNPTGLDALIGKVGTAASVAGKLNTAVDTWSNSATGQLSARQLTATRLGAALEVRQANIDTQFNSAYKRYLAQFTQLQKLQNQMDSTANMFTAMFSSSSDN
jgi:flagellar hook-associated protein 2